MLINLADIVNGVLVNVLWATGQMISRPPRSPRAGSERAIAGWFDTEALIGNGLPGGELELPELPEAEAGELAAALRGDEVQGALQVLLAARLTDAPETDAAKARAAVRLALSGGGTADAGIAEQLSDYYDDKICALVADLEGRVGAAGLSQVRSEAFSTRVVALLGAIERQVAALGDAARGGRAEAEFLRRYRRQARERHGKLEPPDFELRRRVAAEKIYVNAAVTYLDIATVAKDVVHDLATVAVTYATGLDVMHLAGLLDRTVLLGDPGGGKTTAANVLANFYASDSARKIPFLVTVREYARKEPPERSVAGYIEHTLETLYQCAAPDGLVERLLLTGRAVVIFDGLDELLDTSRRREVSERVEQFCSAYPLTPVLVTSRLVGYDQARLDDEQFTRYLLGGFGEDQVAEYARKWFAVQEGATPATAEAEADAFLAESASAPDLRSNPLLLALMCILYRGAGSLPRDRAGIYARCAELLFGKWDAQRHIRRELRAGDFVEPAIRHIAWWMLTSDDSRAAVTERELVEEVTRLLRGRAFEDDAQARAAAIEFVEFCQGRMWVLSDAGTTADGEKLYAFTHRTFLEYFAAAHLAAVSDKPEDLARALLPHLAAGEWAEVSQLAIQLKDRSSDRGADRIYAALIDSGLRPAERLAMLTYLAESVGTVRLSPATVRGLLRATFDSGPDWRGEPNDRKFLPLTRLLRHGAHHEHVIADELSSHIGAMVASDDAATRAEGLQLALEIGHEAAGGFWRQWSREEAGRYCGQITLAAVNSTSLRTAALFASVISIEQALAMPGGFGALMGADATGLLLSEARFAVPYPLDMCARLFSRAPDLDTLDEFGAIGRHLIGHPATPWVRTVPCDMARPALDPWSVSARGGALFGEEAVLGLAAVLCVNIELSGRTTWKERAPQRLPDGLTALLDRYETARGQLLPGSALPDLPVPAEFSQVFRDWAEGRVNFVEIAGE